MSTDLEITAATLHDDGRKLRLELELFNPSERTLHLYRTRRATRYDPVSRVLQVQLSDRGLDPHQHAGSFLWPRFTSIDPGGRTKFGLPLPRVITRVKPSQVKLRTPVIESLPAWQAQLVDIEVAWSGTPFYDDPRPKAGGPRARLTAWATGHATFRLVRPGPSGGPVDGGDPSDSEDRPPSGDPTQQRR